jgi:hypothetical protein
MVAWFKEHRYLDTEESVPVSVGGASGMQFDTAFQGIHSWRLARMNEGTPKLPQEYPSDRPKRHMPLFYHRDGPRFLLHGDLKKYRVIVLNVKGETVTIIIGSSTEHFDESICEANKVLDTVNWK